MKYTIELVPKRSFGLGKLAGLAAVAAGGYYAYQYLSKGDKYEEFSEEEPAAAESSSDDLTERILRAAKRVKSEIL